MSEGHNPLSESFLRAIQHCSELPVPPVRPIASAVSGSSHEIPMLFPSVADESLKQLLMSWYYAGYYTGRHQAIVELQQKKNGGSP
mmetsp:Transcript_34470/g.60505  ORF Transcript_34470/g.60505 Transcript_34470/m.60505 type:complete len:86 (-) Transcript_34470:3170-3427(-)